MHTIFPLWCSTERTASNRLGFLHARINLLYRVLGVIVISAIGLFVLTTTIEGKESLKIILESRTEIRRVVWPTRTETTQTVLIVVVAIIVCALLLWGLDSLFGWATAKLLG